MKILTIDVGGTFIKYAVMNDDAQIFERGKISTPLDNRKNFFNAIKTIYEKFSVEGIAISMPGVIDSARGVCVKSAALSYNDGCNIVLELGEIYKCPVTIENDARCAALAEAKFGSLADVDAGFVIVFGTMIGGTFVQNKKVYKGTNNSAGEISFLRAGEKIFSDICNVPSLLKDYAQMKNLSTENITGEKFFQAVENDKDAQACLDRFTRRIAEKIFDIQIILDVEKFAIGGGISAQKIFIEMIRNNLNKVYAESPIEFNRVEVTACKFLNDANLIGALVNFKNFYNSFQRK